MQIIEAYSNKIWDICFPDLKQNTGEQILIYFMVAFEQVLVQIHETQVNLNVIYYIRICTNISCIFHVLLNRQDR